MFALQLAVLLFGLSAILGKGLAVSALVLVAGRTTFAAITLLLFGRGAIRKPSFHELTIWAALGGILAAHWLTFFLAIKWSTVAIGVLTFAAYPLFTALLEPLVSPRRYQLREFIVCGGIIAGLALVAAPSSTQSIPLAAIGVGLASAFLFSVLSIALHKLAPRNDPLEIAFWQNLFACIFTLPLAAATAPSIDRTVILGLAALGVFCTAAAHTSFIRALRTVPAHQASAIVAAGEPLIAMLLGVLFFGEIPTLTMLVGAAILLFACVFAALRRSEEKH